MFKIDISSSGPGGKAVLDGLKSLEKESVYVGVPEESASRKGEEINNAELVFIHTHGVRSVDMRRRMGAMMLNRKLDYPAALQMYLQAAGSPQWAIPPRPLVEPAIENSKDRIAAQLAVAAKAALEGKDRQAVRRALGRAGMLGQQVVQRWFYDPRNGWPPNAPSTIKRKGSAQPLIDKRLLYRAIKWILA